MVFAQEGKFLIGRVSVFILLSSFLFHTLFLNCFRCGTVTSAQKPIHWTWNLIFVFNRYLLSVTIHFAFKSIEFRSLFSISVVCSARADLRKKKHKTQVVRTWSAFTSISDLDFINFKQLMTSITNKYLIVQVNEVFIPSYVRLVEVTADDFDIRKLNGFLYEFFVCVSWFVPFDCNIMRAGMIV